MKIHNPKFSIIVILAQLVLSIKNYIDFKNWGKENPEIDELVNRIFYGDLLFLFVAIIGLFEMMTKPGRFKTMIRIFLICIVLGAEFARVVPIEDFFFAVYNTAWFSAAFTGILIMASLFKLLISAKQKN